MDKNAIKKYAVWARRELIERVMQRAMLYGITSESYGDPDAESVNGNLLSPGERQQRRALVANIQAKGFEQVMEEAAYTWFNRFAALRFMEVNGYLPSYIRVFTNDAGEFKPQILSEAIHLELPGLDMERVYELESANESGKLFKYLLIVQCNALNRILPVMFQKIDDYTELLLPDNLLREGSVIERMVAEIPEEDWKDSVQILGWLYQYYNSERKDEVFAALRKNVKITKENIPAATQLFTPDWIVRYMVENSLGRLWLEGHPNDELKAGWKYWLDEAQQEPDAEAKLAEIRKGYAVLSPTEIRCIDPCAGSGHILVYMFDVLMQIYESAGYTAREAVRGIIENNLFGLDIDERAAQLAYFSVMMKARQYDRRFLTRTGDDGLPDIPQPRVLAVHESNRVDEYVLDYFVHGDAALRTALDSILHELHDAKEYGSILRITPVDFPALYARFDEIRTDAHMARDAAIDQLLPIVQTAELLASQYHIVVTNPPYMGTSGVNPKALEYVKKHYPDSKSDFSTVMMERTLEMCTNDGFMSMINIPVWMFLSSYEKMRQRIVAENTFINMVHPGRGIFGSDFGTTTFVLGKKLIKGYIGSYRRLFDKQGEVQSIEERKEAFLAGKGPFTAQQDNFAKIPGCPVAYWVSKAFINVFSHNKILKDYCFPKQGLHTGNNNLYLRLWYEVNNLDIMLLNNDKWDEAKKWAKLNKGGTYRKWYGNREYIILWENNGMAIKENGHSVGASNKTFFQNMIGFTDITSYKPSFRYYGKGFIYDVSGPSLFNNEMEISNNYLLGLLNSKVCDCVMEILSPTIHMNQTALSRIGVASNPLSNIELLVNSCIALSKTDWDSFETSWDFEVHPLIPNHPGTTCHPSTGGELGSKEIPLPWRGGPAGDGVVDGVEVTPQEGELGSKEIPLPWRGGPVGDGVVDEMKETTPALRATPPQEGNKSALRATASQEENCRDTTHYMSLPYNPKLKERARELRKAGNLSEVLLWNRLKRGQLHGLDFDRQKIIGNYIVDFYCAALRLVVEIDGISHDFKREYDVQRNAYLQSLGLNVLHFADIEVKKNIENVVMTISNYFKTTQIPLPWRGGPVGDGVVDGMKETTPALRAAALQEYHPGTTCHPSTGGEYHPGTACHPSTGGELRVADCYSRWERECEERFARLKANEEELNRIFIDIYGLQDELTPEVEEKDVTVRRADLSRDIRSLVSYAVGCMFGRYSLDTPGLAYAGGDWDPGRYVTFPADKDGILPICDDEYFHDDIVNLFAEFVKTVYGESTLEENLRFIADALGCKGSSPREMIRNYFLNSFYADHLKIYQKRPIYWLFDSGKKNGFKCLVYLHRYRPDTIARVRTDYVHEQQSRYRTAIADLEQRVNNASTSERLKLSKQLAVLQAQADELQTYEEKIHHLADQMIPLDLDDGVKVNYAKLGEVVRGI